MKLQVHSKGLGDIFEAISDLARSSYEQEPSQQAYSVPAAKGMVNLRRIRLREGMELNWFDASFQEPVTLDVGVDYPHLEIAYTLSGQGCWEADGNAGSYGLSPGLSTFVYIEDKKMHTELMPKDDFLHMELRIDPRHFGETLLPELSRLSDNRFYCRQIAGAPQTSLIVEQMSKCPYSGALRNLYLEGKAFELLAFHLDSATEGTARHQGESKLKADDIRCLYLAKDILSRTWREPPGLLQLARMAGLNDYKLKLGFKELFGTTVFGYVRALRMNEARSLLEQGKVNVSEAAGMVGYHNLSHFSQLFRKTFGYNPSEIRKS
ncbi:AraC family transcriptional regulator [Paenibacillus sp. A3]|nr:AraC family transcriptional regulator [Paenibacillus sp. A3]